MISSSIESKIAFFQKCIVNWYKENARDFPWRSPQAECNEKIISEILLQRTRAETVAGFYSDFMARFPSWEAIAKSTQVELEESLKPIGLWRQRAATILKLAKELEKRNFEFPASQEELEALPGIGQYIANAVLMFCHGQPRPLLDSSMARILERFFGPRKLADIRYDPYLQDLSHKVVSTKNPEITNWGILDLAAVICRKNPICKECPLINNCLFAK